MILCWTLIHLSAGWHKVTVYTVYIYLLALLTFTDGINLSNKPLLNHSLPKSSFFLCNLMWRICYICDWKGIISVCKKIQTFSQSRFFSAWRIWQYICMEKTRARICRHNTMSQGSDKHQLQIKDFPTESEQLKHKSKNV